MQKYPSVILYWSLKQYSLLQGKSPMYYVDQYLKTLKVFSVCLHVASHPALLEKFPTRIVPYKSVEQNQSLRQINQFPDQQRLSLLFQPKYFFFSTSWKYQWLPIWLRTLNPKRYTARYWYWKGDDMVCTCKLGMSVKARKQKPFPLKMIITMLILLFLQNSNSEIQLYNFSWFDSTS